MRRVQALALTAGLVGAIALGARVRWHAATRNLVERMGRPAASERSPAADSLPPPVARYLRLALGDAPRAVSTARVRWQGEFLLREPDGWRPFRATQTFHASPPGFVWDARVQMLPGLTVFVRDGFIGGVGTMHGAVLGLVPVVDTEGTPEIAAGALQRYLGEAVWFPVALQPSHGVRWSALGPDAARATLSSGGTTVSLDVHFGPDGLVERLSTASRFRDVDGVMVPTPWEARVSGYAEHGGMRVPAAGEAAWQLPEGRRPYWRGRVVEVAYE